MIRRVLSFAMVSAAFLPRAGLAHGAATVASPAMPALWDAWGGAAVVFATQPITDLQAAKARTQDYREDF